MLEIGINFLRIGPRTLAESMELAIPAGGIHLLEGPNGCGKSLLLDVVTGVYGDSGVMVRVGDQTIRRSEPFARWQAGIRRLFQAPALPLDPLVREILKRFGFKEPNSGWWGESADLLKDSGVRFDEPFGIHSFGQQRLVELTIALSSGCCCLLDEPFAGLKPSFLGPTRRVIRRAANEGKAILIVDHLSNAHPEFYDQRYDWKFPRINNGAEPTQERNFVFDKASARAGSHQSEARWLVRNFGFGDSLVMSNSTIILPQGGFLMLIGGNGTGKSTLLRSLGGFRQPWPKILAQVEGIPKPDHLFLSPQPPKLVADLTAEENLELMLGKGNKVNNSDRNFAKELLGWLGFFTGHFRKRAEVLSGGETGMLAFVGALSSPARILLLDEPFESFAPRTVSRSIELLKAFLSMGKSAIASTHNAQLIESVHPSQVIDLSSGATVTGSWVGRPLR